MLHEMSASALHEAFMQGHASAEEIALAHIEHTRAHEPSLGAYLHFDETALLTQARALDSAKAQHHPMGPLAAVPCAIKDNIHIEGIKTTCASKMLENYTALFDATCVTHLKKAGALFTGKTNLDEFAMGSSTEKSAFKPTRNPWDLSCVPGGSSGGSSAAVAACFAPLSLGSDTGGSIRQPAAFTGIVGFKPTYGRVSRHGLVAFASSLDQIGPFARSVEDAYLATSIITGPCTMDSTYVHNAFKPFKTLRREHLKGIKIGVPWHLTQEADPEVKSHFEKSVQHLKDLGAEILEINLDILKASIAVYYIIAPAEASANLARFDGIRYGYRSPNAANLEEVYTLSRKEGFGAEVKQRILLGTYVLSSGFKHAYYQKALEVRQLVEATFNEIYAQCDLVAVPCTTTTAFKIGGLQNPLQMYLQDLFTIPANLAGLPAISVPSGFSKQGLPIGLQLQAARMNDELLFSCADAFERAHPEYFKKPPLKGL